MGSIRIKTIKPAKLDFSEKSGLLSELKMLTEKAWGQFPPEFLEKHILADTTELALAKEGNNLIGYSAVSIRKIYGKKVRYIEFTVVDPASQGVGIGPRLTFNVLKNSLIASPIRPVEIMLLTPNVRALSKLAKAANFIYPDPYSADPTSGRIPAADEETWNMARELIRASDNPDRKIDREGLVLHGSYKDAPWLLYDRKSAPWHTDARLNKFAEHYLHYSNGEDREFIVRLKVGLISALKGIIA